MSGATPNGNDGTNKSRRQKKQSKQYQPQATATNAVPSGPKMSYSYEENFPTLQAATSKKNPVAAAAAGGYVPPPNKNKTQLTTSTMDEVEFFAPNHAYSQYDRIETTHNMQPLMSSTQLSSQPEIIDKPNATKKFPVTMPKQSIPTQSHIRPELSPLMPNPIYVPQSATTTPKIPTNNSAPPVKETIRPLTPWEDEVNSKLCEIILTIHGSQEFVAFDEVIKQLFQHFHVGSWRELKVHPTRVNALINLEDRLKNITLYLYIFEQIFHLCTLKDFEPYLIKFLKVDKYEDLLLGPLDKHPEIQRVFKYKPLNYDQSIPAITTGDVIQNFMKFQRNHRHQQLIPFEQFLDDLVKRYELQSRDQLGLFYRSFAYLKQVIGSVRRDQELHVEEVKEQSEKELIEEFRTRLNELKEEMRDAQQLSLFNKKKTPTAVLNHLASIVDKYLDFLPQQPALYAILVQIREDELLRCLLNVSIYLSTIDQPEVFIAELKQLYEQQAKNSQTTMQQLPIFNGEKLSKKDRRKMNAMISQQQSLQPQVEPLDGEFNDQIPMASIPFDTSFASSSLTSHHSNKSKPPISLEQLCLDIYNHLIRFDTLLTIEQFIDIDAEFCAQHGVTSFSAFSYDEHDNDDKPINFVSFLDKYRQLIDPHDELSIYEHTASSGDRTELYSFVQQLSVLIDDEMNEDHQQQQVTIAHGQQLNLNPEKITAVEKAVKHKFHGSIGFRKGNQLIKKAKQRLRKHKSSIMRYEESLLDIHGLNRLDICPSSLNVDETQLCQLILDCPLMTDLYTWFQWVHFFQPKYGALKSFIAKHEQKKLKDLRLLETSNKELFRLPIDATLSTFERELNSMHIRTAVGHLCALIIQQGLVTHISFNVYRTSMITWFRRLRSSTTLQNDHIDSMQYILDFLMYLPELIGQSRVIEELILRPLDDVFGNDRVNGINSRARIWNLADSKQKTKLELWGHTVNITEWQNEKKWLGLADLEDKAGVTIENKSVQKQNLDAANPIMPTTTTVESPPISTSNVTIVTPTITTVVRTDDGDESIEDAFKHIEEIRRGYGHDNGLDSNGQFIVTRLQGVLTRSLEKLSVDLFSNQGHFVLELIQNADDNKYTKDRLPTLCFIVSSERILVCNNEIGFLPSNIAAICDVGASTKGKHKEGYAGHKGIGFKSVFMVSHKPEIHSRNYHLRFDTADGTEQIGYIRPIWVDQYEEILPNLEEWTTCIRLPIKKETQRDRLQQNFDDIQAKLLLFLKNLRQIEIINQQDISSINNNKRIFTRIDHADGQIIELQEKTLDKSLITNFWLVTKKVIRVPDDIKKNLGDVKGNIDSTTIAIAYPLSGIKESSTQLPPIQPLFAYLPLRPYGFRFILQADFEVPATRQEIHRDNLWNDWLKLEMTCLLSLAYNQFKGLPDLLASSSLDTQINTDFTPIQMIKYFLKLIPPRSELNTYFNTFVEDSIKLLMGIIELPVSRQNEKGETVIDWIPPSRCIIVRDSLIRKIISQDLLLSHFNCYYVHEQLALECDEQILLKLGCRPLEFTNITQLIESSYKQTEQQHLKTASSIQQIAQWLVCLDYSLEEEQKEMYHSTHEKETIAKLKQLKMIPLQQQSYLVSADEFNKHGISFPLDKTARFSKYLKLVLNDLPTLDEQLLDFIEDKYPRRVESIKRLLRKLGIRDAPKIQEIYRQHILPVMSDQARWSSKSESILIAYLFCIYEYIYIQFYDVFESNLETLRNTMVVKTRDGTFVSLGSSDVVIHLTSTYSPRISLDSLTLSTYKFTFISDDYYKLFLTDICRSDGDKRGFVSFFKKLNVTDFFQVNFINKPFIQVSQFVNTQWEYLIQSLSEIVHEPFIIKDNHCEEFDKLVSPSNDNQTADLELCVQLLQYLDKHHKFVSSNYAASIVVARGFQYGQETQIAGIESSFCLSLRKHAWIPVTGGLLYKPSEVYYLQSNSETSVFRRYVPHLDTSKLSLHNEDFVNNILGIKRHVTHRTMFELVMKWSCNLDRESLWNLVQETNTSDSSIPCTLPNTFRQTCLDTIDNFQQIYHFLAGNDETRHLLNRFRLWPIIFIPRDQQTGDFLFIHQTFWNDPISLLSLSQDSIKDSKGRIPIQPYYDINPTLQKFFLEILHIEFQPTIDDYLPLLSTIQDINQIWKIIEIITRLAMEHNKEEEIQQKCLDIAFIPCMDNQKKLVKYTDHPFYPHDIDIANLFADTLSIIKLPDFKLSSEFKEQFRLLFEIENLGKVIQTKIKVENEQSSTILTDFYRCSIDLIQYFLLNEKLISADRSKQLSIIFSRMQFICVDHIQISYCDKNNTIKTPTTSHNTDTYVDEQTCKFYILKKFEQSEMRYTDTMVNFIIDDETKRSKLLSYIKDLLQIYQKENAQGLANRREKITEMYEPKWIIPEEIKKDIPVVSSTIQETDKNTSKKPEISSEMIEELKNKPLNRQKLPPRATNKENENVQSKILPPLNSVKTSTEPKSNDSTDENHQASHDHERTDNEHIVRKNIIGDYIDGDKIKKESNENDTRSPRDRVNQHHAPVIISDSSSLPPPDFEHIPISTLINFDLLTFAPLSEKLSTGDPFHSSNKEVDLITGRRGEEIVFRFLQSKYPNVDIKWMNEETESYEPYDIHMVFKSENDREEFIEVKTTRSIDQNTFPVSIGEVRCLIHHPSNYFIYRVYYADPINLSTITVINKVENNLKLQHIKLCMTIP